VRKSKGERKKKKKNIAINIGHICLPHSPGSAHISLGPK
jgi:hypothetical protein